MLFKLAVRNVRRSFRDYGVYLLTLTFGVCLFYTFNSLEGQGAMVYLARVGNPIVEAIQTLMDVFSLFVAVVLACLLLYANRFLLRRRKGELGTYLLLGLEGSQVSRVLFLETGAVGLISLCGGLALGVPASLGLSALTLSMFDLDLSGMLGLTFSPKAAVKTAAYFGLIFLLVMVFSGLQVSRAKLIDLLQAGRRNETVKERPASRSAAELVLGCLCLAAAYAILLCFGMALAVAIPFLCWPMLGLGTLGTFLIFRSLSGFVLSFARSHPRFYYRDLHLFTLRQWLSQVRTVCLSQTVICILLLLSIGVTASAIGLNSTLDSMTGAQSPFDITAQNRAADVSGCIDFDALLSEEGFDLGLLAWRYDAVFYYNDPEVTGVEEAKANGAVRLSDYNALMARQGKPAYAGELPGLPGRDAPLCTGSLSLTCVIVPDEMAEQLKVRRQVWSADYAGDREETEALLLRALRPEGEPTSLRDVSLHLESRLSIYMDLMGNKMLALFLGLYLGFTFLLSAAAVLALQQLSQAADNAGRYAALRRLGAEEGMLARSARQQVALAFFLPLGLSLVHSLVGMKAANDLISQVGRVDSAQSALVTALVLLAVYGGYFLATAAACSRMARKG